MPSQGPIDSIPILDIRLFDGSSEERAAFLADLRHALLHVGFFYIKHDVSKELLDNVLHVVRQFFHLPLEEKLKIDMKNSPQFRGYTRMGAETTNFKQDNREQIDFATDAPPRPDYIPNISPIHHRLTGPNQWPDFPPDFKLTLNQFTNSCHSIAQVLMRAMALSLQLPEDFFATAFSIDPYERFKVVRYPPLNATHEKVDPQSLGVGPHKDYGFLAILHQDPNVPGLQVQPPCSGGVWIDAPPIPDTFVVNIGEAFERMTGGVYIATTHRVVNDKEGRERFSIPYFFNPALDAEIPVINVPEEVKREAPGVVVSDVSKAQQLQDKIYGRNAFRGFSRSHPKVFERHYHGFDLQGIDIEGRGGY